MVEMLVFYNPLVSVYMKTLATPTSEWLLWQLLPMNDHNGNHYRHHD